MPSTSDALLLQISEDDELGRCWLKLPSQAGIPAYYSSLDCVRLLVESERWQQTVSGFYINTTRNDAVRVSYFTTEPSGVTSFIEEFVSESELQHESPPEAPEANRVSKDYGREELRFRRYLACYTYAGLDIMRSDLHHAQCLLATLRFQRTLVVYVKLCNFRFMAEAVVR